MKARNRYLLFLLLLALGGHAIAPAPSAGDDDWLVITANRRVGELDAEYHIGLVAGDASNATATANTTKLNAAMEAMHPAGTFTFASGATGPVLSPIHFAAKRFYFKGRLQTSTKTGGALIGTGSGSILGNGEFGGQGGTAGGQQTHFIRIDPVDDEDEYVFLLRNVGMRLENIFFYGRQLVGNIGSGQLNITSVSGIGVSPIVVTTALFHPYQTGETVIVSNVLGNTNANGTHTITRIGGVNSQLFSLDGTTGNANYVANGNNDKAEHPKTGVGIGIEGRSEPPTGKHYIANVGVVGCNVGVKFLAGHYDEEFEFVGGPGTPNEQHADETTWIDLQLLGCTEAGIRSENQQAVWHRFLGSTRIQVESGGALLDVQRGGLWDVQNLHGGPNPYTVLRVKDWSHNNARMDVNFVRDGGAGGDWTLWEFAGDTPEDYMRWSHRITGHIAFGGTSPTYDPTLLVQPNGLSSEAMADVLFDYSLWDDAFDVPSDYAWQTKGEWHYLIED